MKEEIVAEQTCAAAGMDRRTQEGQKCNKAMLETARTPEELVVQTKNMVPETTKEKVVCALNQCNDLKSVVEIEKSRMSGKER